jgi:hypothetical protein
MYNVKAIIEGNELVIRVNLKEKGRESASGKSMVIASTEGNADVGNGMKLGLNLYKPKK